MYRYFVCGNFQTFSKCHVGHHYMYLSRGIFIPGLNQGIVVHVISGATLLSGVLWVKGFVFTMLRHGVRGYPHKVG